MNILCPGCQSSIAINDSEPRISCPDCGLETDISQLGTYPGAAPTPLVRDLTGETVGGYEVRELIGVGGMGVVYRAVDPNSGAAVAIKVLNHDYQWKRDEFVARFEREAKALERLDHPGIVRILDSGCEGQLYYLITEYVEGQNMAQQLRAAELSPDESVEVMRQICRAIAFAHRHGIVHRDLKPANVVRSGDRVKVLDFGLAQVTSGDSRLSTLTRTDLAMGTFNYLSPEQRTNAKAVDERSDIFSLGVILYELLTGTLPLGRFEPPSKHRRGIDRRLDRIVQRALDADPERRYQSVEQLAADLDRIAQPSSRRRPALVSAAAGMAGIAAALLWMLWPGGEPSAAPEPAVQQVSFQAQAAREPVPKQAPPAPAPEPATNEELATPVAEETVEPPAPKKKAVRRGGKKRRSAKVTKSKKDQLFEDLYNKKLSKKSKKKPKSVKKLDKGGFDDLDPPVASKPSSMGNAKPAGSTGYGGKGSMGSDNPVDELLGKGQQAKSK